MQLSPVLLWDPRLRRVREVDRHAAQQAVAEHRLALVDPAPFDLVMTCWWSLRPDHDAPRDQPRLVGPSVYFDPSGFTAPVLPDRRRYRGRGLVDPNGTSNLPTAIQPLPS